MGFAGRLEGIAPSDIFQIISQNRMTGTLIARCRDGTAMVIFKNGEVIEAASDAPQESLGYLLVSQGLVNEQTIVAAQERRKQSPEHHLGAVLVDMGAISAKALQAVVLRQIERIVSRLVSCDDGFITFDRGETALKRKLNTNEFFLDSGISTEYLMMEHARVVDEERRHGSDRRRAQALGVADRHAGPASAAAMPAVSSWFRAIRLPKSTALAGVAQAVFRKGRQIARSLIDPVRSGLIPWLKTASGRVRAFSPDGRALIFAGIGCIAAGLVLMLLTGLWFPTTGSELVVTGRVVNLRSKPAAGAKVIAQACAGRDGFSHHVQGRLAPGADKGGRHRLDQAESGRTQGEQGHGAGLRQDRLRACDHRGHDVAHRGHHAKTKGRGGCSGRSPRERVNEKGPASCSGPFSVGSWFTMFWTLSLKAGPRDGSIYPARS